MSYVDAGYAIALSVLALYALTLVLRRRRWVRAVTMSEQPGAGAEPTSAHGERS